MAESLGAAVLTLSVDDQRYQAGLNRAQAQAVSGAASINSALSTVGSSLASIGSGLALGAFFKGSIDAAVELETITRKLSNTLGPGGAAGALDFTRKLSAELGLSFKVLAGSFSGFTAAATAANVPIRDQEALFAAISRAGQSLGLSNDELSGSLLALQQVASKGTVQMEELRGQLGERLPIAFAATAKGLGITQQELIKLVESGKLSSGTFFTALTKGLNEITAGTGGVRTAAQEFQSLGNTWDELQTKLGQSLLPSIKAGVQGLAGALKTVTTNLKAFVMVAGGLGTAAAAFFLLAKATSIAAIAQKTLAVAAAVAQTILNPLNAARVAAALAIGAGAAAALGVAFDQAAKENEKLANAADKTKEKVNAQNAAAKALVDASKKRAAEEQKTLDIALKRSQLNLELAGAEEQITYAKQLAALQGTELVKLQNKLAINEKLRQQQAIQLELQRELAKQPGTGEGARSSAKVDELLAKQEQINAEVRKAYADAGAALYSNATRAADALKSAQQSFQSTLRGGFEFLTPRLQQEQLARARASITPLIEQGVIRPGLDVGSPQRLFQVAAFAESFSSSRDALIKAQVENTAAIKELTSKNTNVNVMVNANGQTTFSESVTRAIS